MNLREISSFLESFAPPAFSEEYDNTGLLIGDPSKEITKALITLDITEEVMAEAIRSGCNLVIAHHPLIFKGLKRLTGSDHVQRLVALAIKHNIAVYAIHTNLDNSSTGLNARICEMLGIRNTKVISPKKGLLSKLAVFCPVDHADKVRQALFDAGAGNIGNYDSCSYNLEGFGTFRASENTNPFVGEKNVVHHEKEIRIEVIFPNYLRQGIIDAMIKSHPYEEVAYDIYPLDNDAAFAGSGLVGDLDSPIPEKQFLDLMKSRLEIPLIRHSVLIGKEIRRVAVCTGSGAFLIPQVLRSGAGIYITADLKYHDFFEAEKQLILADIGHFESERFAKDLLVDILIKKFPNFAFLYSKIDTNAVNYY